MMQKVLWVTVLAIGVMVVKAEEKPMMKVDGQRDTALAVVEAATASLRAQPNQLSITINSTGFQASAARAVKVS
jgi:hypothetical protein